MIFNIITNDTAQIIDELLMNCNCKIELICLCCKSYVTFQNRVILLYIKTVL
jgi:hypothetical protein